MLSSITSIAFKAFAKIEKRAAYYQGKGYGSATIQQEVALVESLLDRKAVLAVDIGGNIGEYTAELRARNRFLEIHTFEPSTLNVDKLRSRSKSDKNVYIVPAAVSNIEGNATLYGNWPGSGLGSLTKRNLEHRDIPFDALETIKVIQF